MPQARHSCKAQGISILNHLAANLDNCDSLIMDILLVQGNKSQLKRIAELIEKLGIRPTINKKRSMRLYRVIDKSSFLGKVLPTLE